MTFSRFIGIDYSGAETPESRIKGLQVYVAAQQGEPKPVRPALPAKNWSRRDVAHWLLGELQGDDRLLVGIDHGFSFPQSYFERYRLGSWAAFLDDFCRYWPTDEAYCYVDFIRDGSWWERHPKPPGERIGSTRELRLCERWSSSAKSVFQFDVQGSVAKQPTPAYPGCVFCVSNWATRYFSGRSMGGCRLTAYR